MYVFIFNYKYRIDIMLAFLCVSIQVDERHGIRCVVCIVDSCYVDRFMHATAVCDMPDINI